MDEIEALYDRPWRSKNQIVRANLRLVVSIAKRHVGPGRQLLRAGQRRQHVADPGRGEVRLRPRQQVQHVRQLGDHEELRPHDSRRASRIATASAPATRRCSTAPRSDRTRPVRAGNVPRTQREAQIGKILERLDEREQKIIISRFGLDHGHEPLTLEGSRRRDGRDQGADPADRGPGLEQAADRGRGREDRRSRPELSRLTGSIRCVAFPEPALRTASGPQVRFHWRPKSGDRAKGRLATANGSVVSRSTNRPIPWIALCARRCSPDRSSGAVAGLFVAERETVPALPVLPPSRTRQLPSLGDSAVETAVFSI